jgi:hypothetical protein
MAVKVAATIKPMGTATFPVAQGVDIEITKHDNSLGRLQQMYNDGELGGLPTPSASSKMLISKTVNEELVWAEVDADNNKLANSSNYQTGSQVENSITSALSDYTPTSSLATVATSGSYNDLLNLPVIPVVPTNVSAFNNDSDYQNETQVRALIAAINPMVVEAPVASVSDLPAIGEVNHIYLVTKSSGSGTNSCDEYIWITGNNAHYELIGNTQIAMIASNVSYTNAVTPLANNVALALDDVYSQINTVSSSVLPVIITFTMNVSESHEVGETINSITFDWSYNKEVLQQTLTDCTLDSASVRTAFYSTPLTTNKTFTLTALDKHNQTVSSSLTVNFYHKVYWGSAAIINPYTSAFILGLSHKEFKTDINGSYNMTVATNEYGFICAPDSFNIPNSCLIGGLMTDLVDCGTISFTNASGNTTTFRIKRTENSSLGALSMVFA